MKSTNASTLSWRLLLPGMFAFVSALAQTAPLNPALPTLFIAGDSTAAKSTTADQEGWAEPFAAYFDPAKINVANRARGGRSSRTFVSEGHWDALLGELRQGDFVLIQFGHNDAGALNQEPPGSTRPLRARGTIPGIGEESEAIDNVITGKHEVVHSFGWYLRKMIADVRAHGAAPLVLSLTMRNVWHDGRVECRPGEYRQWDWEVASATGVKFVDLTRIVADRYQHMGPVSVGGFFSKDDIHTNLAGADFNAAAAVAGLKAVPGNPFRASLSGKGRAIAADKGPAKASVCLPVEKY